jgi:uncharacterized protein YndB with AHSA1/START domain
MDASRGNEAAPAKNPTTVERKSDRELVVTRTIHAPARIVFEAFTRAELFQQWWLPRSLGMTLLSCEMDVRVGGRYKLVFPYGESGSMAFFGRYLEVIPHSRLVWTNEEGGEGGAITTVTFREEGGRTHLVISDLLPSKEALDEHLESGATNAMPETLDQLDELVTARSAGATGA